MEGFPKMPANDNEGIPYKDMVSKLVAFGGVVDKAMVAAVDRGEEPDYSQKAPHAATKQAAHTLLLLLKKVMNNPDTSSQEIQEIYAPLSSIASVPVRE
jgi:hypothetical protein